MARKRKNGEGTVRLRKDGRWEGRVVIGCDEKNLPKTKNVLAKTKSECVEKLKQLQEQYTPPKSDKVKPEMPFGEWMDFWYQNYSRPKLRPTTRAGYEGRIYQHIIPELGSVPLNQLTQNDLQQFYARLKKSGRLLHTEHYGKGLSDRMVRACHMNCRSALEKAVQEGLIRVNPAIGCKLPPKKAREMQVLTREEIQRFLIQAKAEGYFELFLLELTTGLRRGELLALQWDDLNLETGELKITKQVYRTKEDGLLISQPKTKSSIRTVSLPPPLLAILKEYKEGVNSRWMFPSPVKEGSPLDPAHIRTRLHLILEHAQCKQIRFHDLRHTFATIALGNGMDVKTLSAMLGHVSAATTLDIYTHITNPMRSEAAAKIDQRIGKAAPQESPAEPQEKWAMTTFQPYVGRKRKSGTGCITQISENCWEGRYSPVWPDGKKHSRNVYAKTREECETLLPGLIQQMKAEIRAIKESGNLNAIPDGISEKKKAIAAYMRKYPEVTSKSAIAKAVQVDKNTVNRYYEEIRREMD
ncbi:Integrase [uncultured Clostridium sp.]|nr:Integrase [uncultured Clostridium sp.]